jgi:hypothetical protein
MVTVGIPAGGGLRLWLRVGAAVGDDRYCEILLIGLSISKERDLLLKIFFFT